ncbi:hypothetical protein KIN20_003897 [Parelaphostrongylus tenuis]|uniref:Uncharacterized protein n=1 Tax=Parelaphostrongylus tenuis TaxID=148309 RepID=A0AAD5QHN7_PARTN|nr:hypothetical protein KIN20_003897 [Parelaphostrongylus tenuis]
MLQESPKDAPSVKRINMNANVKVASAAKAVKVGKPLQRMRSSRSATSVISTGSTAQAKSSPLGRKTSISELNAAWQPGNATQTSPLGR